MATSKKRSRCRIVSKNKSKMTDAQARALWPVFEALGGGADWPKAIKPQEIWEAVKNDRRHPLRQWYEWDLRRAHDLYGLERTRWIIQQVAVRGILQRGEPREFVTRALVRMPKSETHDAGYRPVKEVLRESKNDDIQTRQRLTFLKQWSSTSHGILDSIKCTGRDASILEELINAVDAAIASADASLRPATKAA